MEGRLDLFLATFNAINFLQISILRGPEWHILGFLLDWCFVIQEEKMKSLQETKLIQLVNRLIESELGELERFGRYIGTRGAVQLAFTAFRKGLHQSMDKEKFFNYCYPDPEFSFTNNRFQSLLNVSLEVIYKFLAVAEILNSPDRGYQMALVRAREREWDREILDLAKRLRKFLARAPETHEHYHLAFWMEESVLEAQLRMGELNPEAKVRANWSTMEQLTQVEAFRYQCLILDRKQSGYKIREGVALPDYFLKLLLERNPLEERALAGAYVKIWELLRAPQNIHYFVQARKLIHDLHRNQVLAPGVIQECLSLLFNHALRQVRKGEMPHAAIVDLMGEIFAHQEGKGVHPHQLKNVIAMLAADGKVAEARQVLKQFASRIQGDENQWALKYNEAVLLFYEGDFDDAFRGFQEVLYAPDDQYLKLDGRIYLWRVQIARTLGKTNFDSRWYESEKEKTRQFFRRFPFRNGQSKAFYQGYFQLLRKIYASLGEPGGGRRQEMLRNLLHEANELKEHPLRKWVIETIGAALPGKGR